MIFLFFLCLNNKPPTGLSSAVLNLPLTERSLAGPARSAVNALSWTQALLHLGRVGNHVSGVSSTQRAIASGERSGTLLGPVQFVQILRGTEEPEEEIEAGYSSDPAPRNTPSTDLYATDLLRGKPPRLPWSD